MLLLEIKPKTIRQARALALQISRGVKGRLHLIDIGS
jgi:hypothetical protein